MEGETDFQKLGGHLTRTYTMAISRNFSERMLKECSVYMKPRILLLKEKTQLGTCLKQVECWWRSWILQLDMIDPCHFYTSLLL